MCSISRLKLIIPRSCAPFTLSVITAMFYAYLNKYEALYRDTGKWSYPVTSRRLREMCSFRIRGSDYVIGIDYDVLPTSYAEDYKKILDVEYGNQGIELRLIRRVLEEIMQKVGGMGEDLGWGL